MALKEFKLPDVGEGVAEGELVTWHVAPGDEVTEDQVLAEVETDKALVDVPSPFNGTVKELLAEEGEMVPVGNVIITIQVGGEEEAETAEPEAEAEPEAPAAEESGEAESGGRVFASPSVRRLARELDVDLASVDGSGPSGRVTEGDVRSAAEAAEAAEEAESSRPRNVEINGESATEKRDEGTAAVAESADRQQTLAAPATRALAEEKSVDLNAVPATEMRDGEAFVTPEAVSEYAQAQQQAQAADAEAVSAEAEAGTAATETAEAGPAAGERVPYKGVRKAIGNQMEQSKYTAPHVTHHDEVDVTELVELRSQLKPVAEEQETKLTYMPFVMKAVIAALKDFPYMNSQLDEENEEIVLRDEYNIGVAAATDAGLMVPVVHDADRKGMLQLADEMNEKVQKARDRKISPAEMRGGTFTITNIGGIGGEYATPIINYPEVAILALGAIKDKPRVVDGEVVPRKVLTLSLSFDHRIVDGAQGARFTNRVKELLEDPKLLVLE
ncbi:2-oxo acid dehydrogenase subunit E2 [Haloferax mediterranei ATCC 33500]|uniref:2-oxo acid dehydrogenase subunit E2 n=1 Tax=Haloferax mediterranei (strain ATCC 33500 / DSM 1411 / JCM 8866 / NBRC 14739 / NCIMB 2177 / R-4) TaxID=523841 RepID=I3R8Q8_HALMT|nr:dihydrolipoamide acetyltransferase family protein [Haloferax mediterranei]AFK20618.1 dihydrolipoamide S-acyltransferase (pyruvate dehydrogenase E2 component) [Haloferax mediterranei ATCC 33500]AHZ22898.1 branched-chain alpha-keto acid dehydrogenase subunit E2 [Haloferax mediterranei ATCC 33500]EMA03063.1 branched-chain alpha-keto acid dehydrogenase subunit E2 [Haloferax mediterranei ATCC 33500]MDX5987756.1 dihydrolipoamide acetyltransferase family protein [Haloferax mediterranei ATCC 33500]